MAEKGHGQGLERGSVSAPRRPRQYAPPHPDPDPDPDPNPDPDPDPDPDPNPNPSRNPRQGAGQLHAKLLKLYPQTPAWYKLLSQMVRVRLRL